jgi:hypothetical protein
MAATQLSDRQHNFSAPNIGAATGTSLAVTGKVTSSSPSTGIGYATGAGNTVTQSSNKSTTVIINAICGAITTNNAALASQAIVQFTVTNSSVAATDVPVVALKSGAALSGYKISVGAVAGGSFVIEVQNLSGSSKSDALVINFVVIKAVTS